jgi:DNA polymerase-3 subunit epsilon
MTTIRILFVDTETNGLPKNRYAPPAEHDAWPAILQLSWILCTLSDDGTFTLVDTQDHKLALPPEIPWDAGAGAIHRISEAAARSAPDAGIALTRFAHAIQTCNVVVAHNLSFDKAVIRAAGHRAAAQQQRAPQGGAAGKHASLSPLRFLWPTDIQDFCTMMETRNVVRIPSPSPEARHPFKVPRLSELYTFLYGKAYDVSGAEFHNAMCDVDCLVQCFWGLVERGWISVTDGRLIFTPLS